jgi:hypothetical protein
MRDFKFTFDNNGCANCDGNCCIGESGYIWVTNSEIVAIADFLKIDKDIFVSKYLIKVGYKYSLIEKKISDNNYACIFFDRGCQIYDVRPKQCRTFPFWDYFLDNPDEIFKECPAVTKIDLL